MNKRIFVISTFVIALVIFYSNCSQDLKSIDTKVVKMSDSTPSSLVTYSSSVNQSLTYLKDDFFRDSVQNSGYLQWTTSKSTQLSLLTNNDFLKISWTGKVGTIKKSIATNLDSQNWDIFVIRLKPNLDPLVVWLDLKANGKWKTISWAGHLSTMLGLMKTH